MYLTVLKILDEQLYKPLRGVPEEGSDGDP